MNEINQYSSFLPIPEIVTKSSKLRVPLLFLGKRTHAWEKFLNLRKTKEKTRIDVFLRNFSKFRWDLHGRYLNQTIHTMRLHKNNEMILRPVCPIIASRNSTSRLEELANVSEQVKLFPSGFCEYRLQFMSKNTDEHHVSLATKMFRDNFSDIQQSISFALFGDGAVIRNSFSDVFSILIKYSPNPSGQRISYPEMQPTTLKIQSKNITIETPAHTNKLFLGRVRDALSLAVAYRVVVPAMWSTFVNLDLTQGEELRELVEILFIDLSPRYYLQSKKLEPHILPHNYQRRAFEVAYQNLELDSIDIDIKKEFVEWLRPLHLELLSQLLTCSKPLRGELARTLRKLRDFKTDFEMVPPTSTVFRYLVCAYLRDRYLMVESPEIHKIPQSRIGLRTANKILIGSKKIEDTFETKKIVEKHDIYKVPGRILNNLMEIGVIRSEASNSTSASLAFRINPDSSSAMHECIYMRGNHEIELVNWLGE